MTNWPHAPTHQFNEKGIYMVTGATYKKEHFFKKPSDLDRLQQNLIELANKYCWNLTAWALFSNHYHFIAQSSDNPQSLKNFISEYHVVTSSYINGIDNISRRKVWYQYWDTQLTYQYSYMARLRYVMQNPVKHGLVFEAKDYPWCSASWFEKNSTPAFIKVINSFKIDNVKVIDDF